MSRALQLHQLFMPEVRFRLRSRHLHLDWEQDSVNFGELNESYKLVLSNISASSSN